MNEPIPLMSAVEAAQEAEIARLRAALSLLLDRDLIACNCDEDEMRCQWHYATRQAVAALAKVAP